MCTQECVREQAKNERKIIIKQMDIYIGNGEHRSVYKGIYKEEKDKAEYWIYMKALE